VHEHTPPRIACVEGFQLGDFFPVGLCHQRSTGCSEG
jgi:hypothetical protein